MWDIKPKATNEQTMKTNTQKLIDRQQYGSYQREGGLRVVVKGEESQTHHYERRFDFGWWARNAI